MVVTVHILQSGILLKSFQGVNGWIIFGLALLTTMKISRLDEKGWPKDLESEP